MQFRPLVAFTISEASYPRSHSCFCRAKFILFSRGSQRYEVSDTSLTHRGFFDGCAELIDKWFDGGVSYLHAQWRRAVTEGDHPLYTILDGVKGNGRYVDTLLAWTQLSGGWFGEGEMKFFIYGDKEFPTIAGTGTEDYFGVEWGFPATYYTAYVGNVLDHKSKEPDGPQKWSLYRWHILDPVIFHKDLMVTIQALG
jgi:hypothetical protein